MKLIWKTWVPVTKLGGFQPITRVSPPHIEKRQILQTLEDKLRYPSSIGLLTLATDRGRFWDAIGWLGPKKGYWNHLFKELTGYFPQEAGTATQKHILKIETPTCTACHPYQWCVSPFHVALWMPEAAPSGAAPTFPRHWESISWGAAATECVCVYAYVYLHLQVHNWNM